jgi:hypothetical protein
MPRLHNVVNSVSVLATFAWELATRSTIRALANNIINSSSNSSPAFGAARCFAPRLLLLGSVQRLPRVARPCANVVNSETELTTLRQGWADLTTLAELGLIQTAFLAELL